MQPIITFSTLALACACAAVPAAVPTDAGERAALELDVLEAVFRYQLDHNASSGSALHEVDTYFLSLDHDQDPPPELLARFEGRSPPVEPVSAAEIDAGAGHHVRHRENGGWGVLLRATDLRWIDGDTVNVDGGYYEADRSASGNTYRVERRRGRWRVVQVLGHWIS